jgi:hypothetical protein
VAHEIAALEDESVFSGYARLSADDVLFIEGFTEAIVCARGEEQLRQLGSICSERPVWGLTACAFLVSPYFLDSVREPALKRVHQLDPLLGVEMAKLLKLRAQGALLKAAEEIIASH